MSEKKIGIVSHYFGNISVAAVTLTEGTLAVGDRIHIKGHTSNFFQDVEAMQIEHEAVKKAEPENDIGIKVKEHAREHDLVYKVTAA